MYKAAEAVKAFYSGFLPAYQEGTIPEDIIPPYISFSLSVPEWNQKASHYVRVWDRSNVNTRIIRIADQITRAIGICKKIPFDGGYLVIWPETPLIQVEKDGDARYAYINLSINAYNMPGV